MFVFRFTFFSAFWFGKRIEAWSSERLWSGCQSHELIRMCLHTSLHNIHLPQYKRENKPPLPYLSRYFVILTFVCLFVCSDHEILQPVVWKQTFGRMQKGVYSWCVAERSVTDFSIFYAIILYVSCYIINVATPYLHSQLCPFPTYFFQCQTWNEKSNKFVYSPKSSNLCRTLI